MSATLSRLAARRSLGLASVLAAAAVGLWATPALADTSSPACSGQSLSQPFAGLDDSSYYTLVPDGTFSDASAAGWQLSGGARIIQTTASDGSTANVLDLPSGSKAVTPVVCVTSSYPTARMYVRNVVGAEGVFFYVSYEGTSTWTNPKNTGQVHGQHTAWTLSDPVNLQPFNTAGAQQVRFTLVPGGQSSDFQVDDFYVDPRML